jgi:16S rRNA (cytidine1402-2'-O)-methyltransferase
MAPDDFEDPDAEADGDLLVEASASPVTLIRRDPGLAAGLYLVATPIGHLRDVTLRALDVLASVDLVCAEDTRMTRKLLSAYGIAARLRPYHDHNGAKVRPALLADLERGARIALVSDAGTPLVSDPGYKLVREAVEAGVTVHAIPGASAVLAGLGVAGLPTDRFLFAGFPPQKAGARRTWLAEIGSVPATLVLFEGPSRVAATLADMASVLGPREGVVARELTKTFEEVRRGRLDELAARYAEEDPPRGEVVILAGPPIDGDAPGEADLEAALLGVDPARPVREAAEEIAARLGLPRKAVYRRLLEVREARSRTGDAP